MPSYDQTEEDRTVKSSGEELQHFIVRMCEESDLPPKKRRKPKWATPIEALAAKRLRLQREIATHRVGHDQVLPPPK